MAAHITGECAPAIYTTLDRWGFDQEEDESLNLRGVQRDALERRLLKAFDDLGDFSRHRVADDTALVARDPREQITRYLGSFIGTGKYRSARDRSDSGGDADPNKQGGSR